MSHRRRHGTNARGGVIRRIARSAVLLLAVVSTNVSASLLIENIPDIDLGTWTPGMGPVSVTQDFCVESNFLFFAAVDWAGRLTDLSGASTAGQFRLGNASGTSAVGFTARLVDLVTNASEELQPGVLTPMDQTGAFRNCPNGINARLEFSFEARDLEGAGAGAYEGDFEFYAFGQNNFPRPQDGTDTFRLRIRVPELVQVSDLDDIALGAYGGFGDLSGTDSVCVYRNDAAAAYEVQAHGQGAGNAFVLEQGASSVPFEVEFDDGTGYAPLSAGEARAAGGADSASTSCGGAANAALRVTVRETDLASADAGAYAGTLTLTVAPL
ncbi:MAG: hypothetical protein V2J24_03155 [Pseudomonadales bacterium]|jgi:hypothetical protein|nr:hypothetical protein [Pseudomonadales bacterium]